MLTRHDSLILCHITKNGLTYDKMPQKYIHMLDMPPKKNQLIYFSPRSLSFYYKGRVKINNTLKTCCIKI